MSSNLKALHTYFYSLQENPKKKSPARLKERKKRIIELIIKENHCCDPGTRRKMRKTLPLGIFQKKKREERSKFKPCQQEEHKFWFWLKEIVKRNLSLA
jgi:hypothetical protein